ncbi:hypothetical protein D3C71_1346690 [compost metagenome]
MSQVPESAMRSRVQLSASPPGAPRLLSLPAPSSARRTPPSASNKPRPLSDCPPALPATCRCDAPQSSERTGESHPPLRSCGFGPAPALVPGRGDGLAAAVLPCAALLDCADVAAPVPVALAGFAAAPAGAAEDVAASGAPGSCRSRTATVGVLSCTLLVWLERTCAIVTGCVGAASTCRSRTAISGPVICTSATR